MAKSEAKHDDKACPCGSKVFASCCWPYHSGAKVADTPEKLMRARYSAYVTMDEDYLRATWHPSTRPDDEARKKITTVQARLVAEYGYDDYSAEEALNYVTTLLSQE